MEIERKFTIKELPKNLEQYEYKIIEQGYLNTKPVLRIRRMNDDYILTYKSKDGIQDSNQSIVLNNEVELPLNQRSYEHLKEKVDDNMVSKKRYIIPIENGLKVEFDIFEGKLKGLYLAEVEFSSIEEANEFVPLDWFHEDVSDDSRYRNSYLSMLESLDEF